MVRAVELNQLAEVGAALPARAMRLAFAYATPQPRRKHPTTQGFASDFDAVIGGEMFRRQGRPEALAWLTVIVLAHQLQNLFASLVIAAIGGAPDVAMHECLAPAFAVTLLQALRLTVAQLQQLPRFA